MNYLVVHSHQNCYHSCQVNNEAAVLGFVGAPFTLASYVVEGGSSKNFTKIKKLAFSQPKVMCQIISSNFLLPSFNLALTQIYQSQKMILCASTFPACMPVILHSYYIYLMLTSQLVQFLQRLFSYNKSTTICRLVGSTGTKN